jgi:hypothetical protein
MVHCTGHQRRTAGNQPGRVIRPNSSHRTLINRARQKFDSAPQAPSELEALYGGGKNWWGKVISRQIETPKFLHAPGVARLVRYLDDHQGAHVPAPASEPTLEEAHEQWRKSQEVVSDKEHFSALQANVHDLSARLVKLESMVAEVLQTLTKGA